MVDRHAVQEMLRAGLGTAEVARHFQVSARTVQRIRAEGTVGTAHDREARQERGVGRPPVGPEVRERLRA